MEGVEVLGPWVLVERCGGGGGDEVEDCEVGGRVRGEVGEDRAGMKAALAREDEVGDTWTGGGGTKGKRSGLTPADDTSARLPLAHAAEVESVSNELERLQGGRETVDEPDQVGAVVVRRYVPRLAPSKRAETQGRQGIRHSAEAQLLKEAMCSRWG